MKKILIILAILFFNIVSYSNSNAMFCTQEVKLCEDWSYVSRTGANCEFAQCSNIINTSFILTSEIKELVDNKLEIIFNRLWDNKKTKLQSVKTKLEFLQNIKPEYSELFEYITSKVNSELD